MTTGIESSLSGLDDWVRAVDDHAAHHLPLLEQAGRVLAQSEQAPEAVRRELADKLERWRYQHLNRRWGAWLPGDAMLADGLDLAANQLAGRRPRPARATWAALGDATLDTDAMAEALALLDAGATTDELARRAAALTLEHFGAVPAGALPGPRRRRVLMYAPLYVSSFCVNHCLYCGFRYPLNIERRHLSPQEAIEEAEVLRRWGFRHLLVVAGDFPKHTTTGYFCGILEELRRRGVCPAVEIAPQSTEAYARLVAAGACGLTLYQETYDERLYRQYHGRGPKASYHWRLEAMDRAAEAGMPRLGLGILLGLNDPRRELLFLMRHARYLQERFPRCALAFSLPRIHHAPAGFHVPHPVDDETFVRLYCALRIAFPQADLVLSTREPPPLRDRLAGICITRLSAGSSTAPGGYARAADTCAGQFPVTDHRSPAEVARCLQNAGIEVRWSE